MKTVSLLERRHLFERYTPDLGRLVVQGTDQVGIVARITETLSSFGANIEALDQHTSDPNGGRFFQRTVFTVPHFQALKEDLGEALASNLADLVVQWRLTSASSEKRIAVFASKSDHCLLDLLWRQRRGELSVDIAMVISNHPDLGDQVRAFGIPFFFIPVERAA